GQRRVLQQAVEQSRLAGTEETGQHRNGNGKAGHRRYAACRAYWSPSAVVAASLKGAGLSGRPAGSGTSAHSTLPPIAPGSGPVAPPSPTATRVGWTSFT